MPAPNHIRHKWGTPVQLAPSLIRQTCKCCGVKKFMSRYGVSNGVFGYKYFYQLTTGAATRDIPSCISLSPFEQSLRSYIQQELGT